MAVKSADNIQALTAEFRKTFGLSAPEGVIQNYKCSYGLTPGHIYISQNYVCFLGAKDPLKIPFVKITNIEFQGIKGFHKILVTTENNPSHTFGVFSWASHCRHAYYLMAHIWKNPPTYIDVKAIRTSAAAIDRSNEAQQQSTQQRAKVNVEKARELLRIVAETDDMQNQAMKQLAQQAEQLDRIEDKLEKISDDLKRADHLMKGIESMPYYLFGGSKKGVKEIREKQFKDRSIKVPEGTPPVIEVEILYKSKDSLAPALMVFEPERFRIVNPKTDKPIATGTVYAYVDVDTITVRARNEYLDIQFNTKKKNPYASVHLTSKFSPTRFIPAHTGLGTKLRLCSKKPHGRGNTRTSGSTNYPQRAAGRGGKVVAGASWCKFRRCCRIRNKRGICRR